MFFETSKSFAGATFFVMKIWQLNFKILATSSCTTSFFSWGLLDKAHEAFLKLLDPVLLCLKEDEGVSKVIVLGSKIVSKERFIKLIFNQQTYVQGRNYCFSGFQIRKHISKLIYTILPLKK